MFTVTPEQALGIALDHHRAGRLAEAEAIYRQLHALQPQHAEVVHLLGVVAHQSGRLDEALDLIQRAIAADPGAFPYYNNLGLLLSHLGRREEAVAAYHTAIRLEPGAADAYYNLGNTLGEMGRPIEAVQACQTALRLQPGHGGARLNFGTALARVGRMDEAIAHYRAVLAQEPANVSVLINLGNLLKDLTRLEEAVELYRAAARHAPNDASAINNLGVALKVAGEIDEAIDCLARSVALDPHRPELHSNLIYTSTFRPSTTPAALAGEMHRWNTIHAAPLRRDWLPHPNDRSPERRLRIGYVSPDFHDHVVGHTLLPAFEAHDRTQFDLFCYSETVAPDEITARFRALSTGWCDTAHLSDADLAAQIRRDRIDLLIDLALHTAHNRLPLFARKPAPVQLAWLGYPGPTGLEAMDYWVADPILAPPGPEPAFERPIRLPDAWCCYPARPDSPGVSALPASSAGFVTFGSCNNFTKINDRVLALWAQIMHAVAGSRLLLVLRGSGRDKALRTLAAHGIGADRVDFSPYYPGLVSAGGKVPPPAYLERYHRIDIALDPFPYNGMTTTNDALWMGVPVIALTGEMTHGRASCSLLANVGLPGLAASSEAEYVRIAAELARDLPRLATLRATLRERMQRSPLLDAPRFTRHLEAAFRTAWRYWCAQP